jgi:hypothetical protein
MMISVVEALDRFGEQVRRFEKPGVGVVMHVHETRRDDFALGVDDLVRRFRCQISDQYDPISFDTQVCAVTRRFCAVDDESAPDDDVVH